MRTEPAAFPYGGPLPRHQRLTLALAARGYSPTQIAGLRRVAVGEVIADLRRAVDLLGAPTLRDAVAAARRHGLLGVPGVPA